MKVLVVSDPAADMAAAAVCVGVGSFSDPKELPGLAHFCEHMLFMGTDKYPDENEWSAWLSSHSGMSNAFTASDKTNYFFEVASEHLKPALDRFSRFFVAPLMKPDGASRELNAVDSEHAKNVNDDMWRLMQLDRSTAQEGHPYCQFATGDSRTLRDRPQEKGIAVHEALLDFHARHYCASRMTLVILGKESEDELLEWGRELFRDVKQEGEAPQDVPEDPYGSDRTKVVQVVTPLRQSRRAAVSWAVPSSERYWRSKPQRLLSHLLGHEGKGSLLSYLKRRGWATALMAGSFDSNHSFDIFACDIDVTEEGLQHRDDVVAAIFAYLRMLRSEGPQQWIFDECAAIAAMEFRFKPRGQPSMTAMSIAGHLLHLPLEHSVAGHDLFYDFDPEAYTAVLDALVPEQARVRIIANELESECTQAEPWYGTAYQEFPVSEAQLEQWRNSELPEGVSLPSPNPFLPTDFTIRSGKEPHVAADEEGADAAAATTAVLDQPEGRKRIVSPEVIRDDERALVFFRQDDWFAEPKVFFQAAITSADGTSVSPKAAVLSGLYTRMLREELNELAYDAEMAHLRYDVRSTHAGLMLTVAGFNDKLPELLRAIVDKMQSRLEFSVESFEDQRYAQEQDLASWGVMQPFRHAVFESGMCLSSDGWHHNDKLDAIRTLKGETGASLVREFGQRLRNSAFLRILVHGNATQEEAHTLANLTVGPFDGGSVMLHDQFFLPPVASRATKLPRGVLLRLRRDGPNSNDDNAALDLILQVGMDTAETEAMVELLSQMTREPAFDQLRTKEALGYIVIVTSQMAAGVQGLRVVIQSNRLSGVGLESRAEAFLEKFGQQLAAMDDEEFAKHVRSVEASLQKAEHTIAEEAMRMWSAIGDFSFEFDRVRRVVHALRRLTKERVAAFYDASIRPGGADRRRLAVVVEPGMAQSQAADEGEEGGAAGHEQHKEHAPAARVGPTVDKTQGLLALANGARAAELLQGQEDDTEPHAPPVFEVSHADDLRTTLPQWPLRRAATYRVWRAQRERNATEE